MVQATQAQVIYFESALKPWWVALGYAPVVLIAAGLTVLIGMPLLSAAVLFVAMLSWGIWYNAVRQYEVWPDRVRMARWLWRSDISFVDIAGFEPAPVGVIERIYAFQGGAPVSSLVRLVELSGRSRLRPLFWPKDPEAFVRTANAARAAWFRAL